MKNDSVVAGGGAIDMELSKYLRNYSRTIAGKEQLIIGAMAKAFEVIARQLCDNAGFDATNILNKLRQKHAQDEIWFGVDVMNEDIADNFEACVWEPSIVKSNAIIAASEATCLLLRQCILVFSPAHKSNLFVHTLHFSSFYFFLDQLKVLNRIKSHKIHEKAFYKHLDAWITYLEVKLTADVISSVFINLFTASGITQFNTALFIFTI